MTFSRRVKPRATRSAVIVASVPEFTSRTIWIEGIRSMIIFASVTSAAVGAPKLTPRRAASQTAATTSGCACPRMSGPHEPT